MVVPFHVYCSSAGMSVAVHSSLICDTSSVCMSMACVVLYGSNVDVGGCPGPSVVVGFVFCALGGVADFLSRVTLIFLGACPCCSSTVGALFIVALALGVALDAGVRVDVDACCPDAACSCPSQLLACCCNL